MAPEVFNGGFGKKIDEYACGVVFYRLLTDEFPYEYMALKSDLETF